MFRSSLSKGRVELRLLCASTTIWQSSQTIASYERLISHTPLELRLLVFANRRPLQIRPRTPLLLAKLPPPHLLLPRLAFRPGRGKVVCLKAGVRELGIRSVGGEGADGMVLGSSGSQFGGMRRSGKADGSTSRCGILALVGLAFTRGLSSIISLDADRIA